MCVRKVAVVVLQRVVAVRVPVFYTRRDLCRVGMAVVFVVGMRVVVLDFLVLMRMLMTLAQM